MNVVQIGLDYDISESIRAAVSTMDLPIQLYSANEPGGLQALLRGMETVDVVITCPEIAGKAEFDMVRRIFRGHTIFIVDDEKDFKDIDFGKNIFFIRRPVDPFYVRAHLTTCASNYRNASTTITVNARRRQRPIAVSDILYIEGQKNNVMIHTKEEVIKLTAKVIDYVDTHETLVRCHQSFIVNLSHIQQMERLKITLEDGTFIPISRTYLRLIHDSYDRFKGGKLK